MTDEEIEQLEASIVKSKDALAKGLLLPEDASQLYRMIAYYEDKIKEAKKNERTGKSSSEATL